jgi:hypothetical protein
MAIDEMKERAISEVQSTVPNIQGAAVLRVYENVLDGTLVTVGYKDEKGNKDMNHVLFDKDSTGRPKFYRYHSDVLIDVSHYKERSWFFRFIQFTGVGGLIALILILIFSGLLCVLAFFAETRPATVEVAKLSLTTILGFFFGSQTSKK